MNRISAVLCVLMVSGFCLAQSPSSANSAAKQPSAGSQPSAPPVTLAVQLSKSLDSRKLKPGDAIEARFAEEMRMSDGTVVPRGSKVMGHVSEATARAKGDSNSALGMVFDRIVLKDGRELSLKASIQAVGAPRYYSPSAMNMGNGAPMPGAGAPPGLGTGAPGPMGGINPPGGLAPPGSNFPTNAPAGPQPQAPQENQPSSAQLNPQSTGVIGLHDLQLAQDSILASSGKEVKLPAGSQILLRVQNQ